MKVLHKHWLGILLRGLLAIIFGIIAIFAPGLALEVLVLFFGAYAFVDGAIAFFVGLPAKSAALIFEGIVGILVGLFVFFFTAQSVLVFLILIGVWAIGTGILEVVAAIELRKYISNEFWLLLGGIISVLFGIVVLVNPLISAIAISFLIGVYAVLFGILLTALALKVREVPSAKSSKRRK